MFLEFTDIDTGRQTAIKCDAIASIEIVKALYKENFIDILITTQSSSRYYCAFRTDSVKDALRRYNSIIAEVQTCSYIASIDDISTRLCTINKNIRDIFKIIAEKF